MYISFRAINKMTIKCYEDIIEVNRKADAYESLITSKNKEYRKGASVAKMQLTKNLNKHQKNEKNEKELVVTTMSPLDKIKIALFDNLVSNVKAINALNQFETMRVAFCVIMSLILLPFSVRNARGVSKKEMNDLFCLNGKSLLLKHCYNKADELERSKLINGGELNLTLLEAAILAIQRNTRSDISYPTKCKCCHET
jgi:hypothetical protein